ncbi:TPA: gamma-glutamyl-gamma-aminobutyrate hydrolase family protein [Streptococcus suis]|uniref:Gamma-glutamyl-gamma-aminobutyrate hydrolase family protein n=1 Tax=Streptococcus suivaginalis TaxID=3028082 RepID=A0AA96VDK5_9STRE|nr:gamma-glutamyl-gamma-aminobutyrate hydrolase family protein [Streptococcus sp. 29896]MCK4027178.1 gamma-glutamyl-gamma-aminobutyrate hydrolase family protein [Streptococcus suis]WNY46734.1 gamma-glutamyl-gamma-aminobutyrate hydrolase family protein [Streptococcus sp. 29896]HEL1587000.1 gamma-glutamyl-gamma-aminobutyrate hydrolase family protein [Streptococcus suis]
MAKVLVGITGNEKHIPGQTGMTYVTVASELAQGVSDAGGLPIVIPMGEVSQARDYVTMIDKLILSGGQHVDPRFYGEEKSIESDDYLLARDEFELALIREALKQNKPIFAVCRGMQLLNVALGGSLHQAIEDHWQDGYAGTSHSLRIKPHSRVGQLFDQGSQINSFHRQSIKDLAPGLVATAHDPRDGTIEAFESRKGASLLGIQWHPEFLWQECERSRQLFRYLVEQL